MAIEHARQPGKPAALQAPMRFVTAASLFDGHDASINIMRRILQASGAEVIHLGHNRSVDEIVRTAVAEDADAVAVSSYQGGHMEYFAYLVERLRAEGAGHVQVFGGGGGVIVPDEIRALHAAGVRRIFSPDDGRALGLQGMIDHMLEAAGEAGPRPCRPEALAAGEPLELARALSVIERGEDLTLPRSDKPCVVVGFTGTGGAGKSSLVDEVIRRWLETQPGHRVAILSVDPSQRRSGGALLGDRIRMNAIHDPRVYMRSLATREAHVAVSAALPRAIDLLRGAGFDLVIVETAGIGQADSRITDLVDVPVYVMTSEFGAPSQLEKIDMLALARIVVLNKCDKRGSEDALRDVRKQVQRHRGAFDVPVERMPVYGTMASWFDDEGTWVFFEALVTAVREAGLETMPVPPREAAGTARGLLPASRVRYLAEIAETIERDAQRHAADVEAARQAYAAWTMLGNTGVARPPMAVRVSTVPEDPRLAGLVDHYHEALDRLSPEALSLLVTWPETRSAYAAPEFSYTVRDKVLTVPNRTETLSGLSLPRVIVPQYSDWGDVLTWQHRENVPGRYPYTAGVFPFKREGEDPTRMFAGEGTPERTNKRFHYLSSGQPATRLSTAFDSVTLYGEDPAMRPDIHGKIGNSGVSICTVDDMRKLYAGFDLCEPSTSVSMTINGPAPMILAMFLAAAVSQQVERHLLETIGAEAVEARMQALFADKERPRYVLDGQVRTDLLGLATLGADPRELVEPDVFARIRAATLRAVRGTVQADILKEDQAQNTCIFSTEFALRMMGDIQQVFISRDVRNFYSVSISGYHIAEAGANPITQLAFTLANGFTYVEAYLARGMAIDDFAPNLSFFFSNGLDPEYAVIGRVARRIWARAMKLRYGASPRAQMLKYHIQTSGRSLHAQEIDFNDIRTTFQAVYAILDNCNSLHTNAYDEAITTPTEASVRRAMAIQLIINRELGLAKNQNPWQGSAYIEALTDLVEQAVLLEFGRISDRGGVLGAMETMYQRGRIQEESLHYEHLKHSGELPIIGVNTFLNPHPADPGAVELIRSTPTEKQQQIDNLAAFRARHADRAPEVLASLVRTARSGGNLFEELLETVAHCSLGQISATLYAVGGQYRRSM
ncbi:MAG: methylmalonyl-CoA mutase family protein [Candidatus Sericytochromatia bacterium]|nr:methylmalonyl-CoA mutase family protein [Candidatus Sericytochromatia bacterium]